MKNQSRGSKAFLVNCYAPVIDPPLHPAETFRAAHAQSFAERQTLDGLPKDYVRLLSAQSYNNTDLFPQWETRGPPMAL